jgi:glyoxylase-like metal-dependent hydrolase (beta-lactamase superfamily II)
MAIQRILPNLFRIEVPLPGNPLGAVNSYVIRADRPLIIDTGFDMDECFVELVGALREIGLDFKHADYFATHLHADHLGLAGRLTRKLYMSRVEAETIGKFRGSRLWHESLEYYRRNGFPEEDAEKMGRIHSMAAGYWRVIESIEEFQPLSDGDILHYGEYSLRAVLTPGHTPGHMCLYDEDKKILFSGDHILFDITPNISSWKDFESLEEYLKSLRKILQLEVSLTLPGHRGFQGDVKRRIIEIEEHHERRLGEVVEALRRGSKSAWQVAPHITWNIRYSSWDEIPTLQRWFIMGETLAHLHYLERKGVVEKQLGGGAIRWGLKP